MRIRAALLVLALAGPASAQSLDGSIASGLQGGISSGLGAGGLQSGLESSLGTRQQGRTRARLDESGFGPDGSCAPSQIDLNHTGCRPVREFTAGSVSNYDLSIQQMRPLTGLQLQGLTIEPGPGPAGPID